MEQENDVQARLAQAMADNPWLPVTSGEQAAAAAAQVLDGLTPEQAATAWELARDCELDAIELADVVGVLREAAQLQAPEPKAPEQARGVSLAAGARMRTRLQESGPEPDLIAYG